MIVINIFFFQFILNIRLLNESYKYTLITREIFSDVSDDLLIKDNYNIYNNEFYLCINKFINKSKINLRLKFRYEYFVEVYDCYE